MRQGCWGAGRGRRKAELGEHHCHGQVSRFTACTRGAGERNRCVGKLGAWLKSGGLTVEPKFQFLEVKAMRSSATALLPVLTIALFPPPPACLYPVVVCPLPMA